MLFLAMLNLILCASTPKGIEKAREEDPQYQYNLGLFHLNNNNFDEAIKYFQKALSLNPRYYLAYNGLGLSYSMKGKLQESIKHFQKCLELNPLFSEARNNLGSIYQELGLIEQAEQEYKKALSDENYSTKELPYYNLARLYLAQGKYGDALDFVEKSLLANNRLAMAFNLKGLILEKMNRNEEALSCYERAVKIVPEDIYFNFNLAVAYFKTNQFAKAKEIFEKISLKPLDAETKTKINEYLKMIRDIQK